MCATVAVRCAVAWSLLSAPMIAVGAADSPELILYNGKIFTSDSAQPYAEALAIRGERIAAIGDAKKVRALADARTKQIDLGGRTVIPGIDDAHSHLGIAPDNVELKSPNPTRAEVGEAIAAAAAKTRAGVVLFGWVGPSAYFDLGLDRDFLDKLAPQHPVVLLTTGHAGILNSAALAKFGIGETDPDPLGGRYERGANGKLDGILREYAALNIERKVTDLASDEELVKDLAATLSEAGEFGITSIQDMSGAIAPERGVALLKRVSSPIRVRIVRMAGTTPNGRDTEEGVSVLRVKSGAVSVSGTKWLLDGTLLEGTFASRQAQAELFDRINQSNVADHRSLPVEDFLATQGLIFSRKQMELILDESRKTNDQLVVHVNGYPAASAMLDAMQVTGGKAIWDGRRVRFEHGDGLFPDLVPRVREMGVIVVQNPGHLAWGRHFDHGIELAHAQPLKSLIDAGIVVAFGSDGAGTGNPFRDIMLATTHPDRPTEAITREQAVVAYTLNSSYAEFAEKDRGSLQPGKLADLAVLSQDIFSVGAADLAKTRSIFTTVGGAIVYDAGVLHQ